MISKAYAECSAHKHVSNMHGKERGITVYEKNLAWFIFSVLRASCRNIIFVKGGGAGDLRCGIFPHILQYLSV